MVRPRRRGLTVPPVQSSQYAQPPSKCLGEQLRQDGDDMLQGSLFEMEKLR